MAKGPLFISTFQGKLGNIVGYTLKDSNDKVVQATRVYQPNVANPKTELQALQRMKMAPAVNFYRQLSRILDNAWQGQRYGVKSRQYFMSLAMKQSVGIPFLVKGDKGFYPGEYPVSEGSIPKVEVSSILPNHSMLTSLVYHVSGSATWGEVSQDIINSNFGIVDGDKLTFIGVTESNGSYVPIFSYVILNTTSQSPSGDVLALSHLSFAASNGKLSVGIDSADLVAAAAIVSRLESGSWLRSNAFLFCTEDYKNLMMGQEAYNASIASYTDTSTMISNWYLNEGIIGGSSNYTPGGGTDSNLSIINIDSVGRITSGSTSYNAAVALMSNGSYYAVKTSRQPARVVDYNGGHWIVAGVLGSEILADDTSLAAIAAVADVTLSGWVTVSNYLPADDGNEDPEP